MLPGFYHQYHKKESHQLHKFFGNEHKGGEYHKFGMQNSRHKSDSSNSGKGNTKSNSASSVKAKNSETKKDNGEWKTSFNYEEKCFYMF